MSDSAPNAAGVSRPDLSTVVPDTEPAREKLLEVGSYMRALGLEPSEINKLTIAHRKPGDVVITGSILVKIISEAEQVGETKRRSKRRDHPGQTTLFSSTPPVDSAELVDRVAAQFAINVAADVVTEQVIEKIGPAVVKIKNQADATEARLDGVAAELEEIKAKLAKTDAAKQLTAKEPPAKKPVARQPKEPRDQRHFGGKRESCVFHGSFQDELLAAFSASFQAGREGDVARTDVLAMAGRHQYGASENTILQMMKDHLGTVRNRRECGVSYWAITRESLDRALARRAAEKSAKNEKPTKPQSAPAPIHSQSPQQPKPRKGKRRGWSKKEWGNDKTVKTPQVLLRFPQVSEAELYRWVEKGEIPCHDRVAGDHYYFRAPVVAKAIRRLLRDR